MPKSLYQYRICPEHQQQIEAMLNQILPSHRYKPDKEKNVFSCGGFIAAKRKIEYKIIGDILNICIWKVFKGSYGRTTYHPISSAVGFVLNSGMKNTIENTINIISQQYPLALITCCMDVDDNFIAELYRKIDHQKN
ncbi:MAG: hypothetical protein E7399_04190 [Ruminococcaceae bacterium]|nr:hypothetical protein [Oscillospiraceae bacterium]